MKTTTEEKRELILAAFNKRYATKKFNSAKKIDDADWQIILESARLSPSSFGYEPWKFLLINNQEIKNELKEFASGAINSLEGASHFIIILARKQVTATSKHVQHMVTDIFNIPYSKDSPQTKIFQDFQEQKLELRTDRELFDWASKQTYIPLANMMTTASLLGIDSCPIEGFSREQVDAYLVSKQLIDPNEFGVSVMLGLGYRDEKQPVKTRQPVTDILTIID